jgi:hypothetical protein
VYSLQVKKTSWYVDAYTVELPLKVSFRLDDEGKDDDGDDDEDVVEKLQFPFVDVVLMFITTASVGAGSREIRTRSGISLGNAGANVTGLSDEAGAAAEVCDVRPEFVPFPLVVLVMTEYNCNVDTPVDGIASDVKLKYSSPDTWLKATDTGLNDGVEQNA